MFFYEAAFSGGVYTKANSNHYIYINTHWWHFSTAMFYSIGSIFTSFRINASGVMANDYAHYYLAIRPVI